MELYILRHGLAADREAWMDSDSKRPLTEEGQKKMERIAKAMQNMQVSFDAILSSPYTRALQTAEIVAKRLEAQGKLELNEHLACGGDQRLLMEELGRREDTKNVLLVGHEPDLSTLISYLICGSERAFIEMKKGGLAKLNVSSPFLGQCAALSWLMTPRQLMMLA
ncbi:MAG: phosphohistidine phosphatase SixA [Deltaproteobacteria bacterium]|nr:phosphohistidine phosphatase SixA [Deltaproteobacteria bacterium]